MDTKKRAASDDTGPLGLKSILVDSLPVTLLTDEAPSRYRVEAVFTRRLEPDEADQVDGADTRGLLDRAGYPDVTVAVSDRRLEITNTNLEELRDGLGSILATRLAEIGVKSQTQHELAAARFRAAADCEQDRVAAVALLAESVDFIPGSRQMDPSSFETDRRFRSVDGDPRSAQLADRGL